MTITTIAKELGVSRALIYRRVKTAGVDLEKSDDGQISIGLEQKIRELFPDYPRRDEQTDDVEDVQQDHETIEHYQKSADDARKELAEKDLELRRVTIELDALRTQVDRLRADLDAQRQVLQLNAVSIANLSQSLRAALPAPAPTDAETVDAQSVNEPVDEQPADDDVSAGDDDAPDEGDGQAAEDADDNQNEPIEPVGPFKRVLNAFRALTHKD